MARKVTKPVEEERPPILIAKREEVKKKIDERIAAGNELLNRKIETEEIWNAFEREAQRWAKYNYEFLVRSFNNKSIAGECGGYIYSVISIGGTSRHQIETFRNSISRYISKLESIKERLDLIPEIDGLTQKGSDSQPLVKQIGEDIFIVHGQNEKVKLEVSDFIKKLGLNAIILHEQPNKGRTIIEKFEEESLTAGFAIILLTADDLGFPKDNPDESHPRARQNVILELGYFFGKLGRKYVCALYENGVQLPSDFEGIIYIPLNSDWRLQLAKEIKHAGIDIDLNRAI
jgi:predicted nucleotide-binding protein